MKSTHFLTVIVVLMSCATVSAYEFEARSPAAEADWESFDWKGLASGEPVGRGHQVTATVKPQECRFYLTYDDEGRDHAALLEQAKVAAEQLDTALADVEQAKVEILPLNYSPEKSWRGLFVGEKAELSVTFRVTITLAAEGEDAFWRNADSVARVLEALSQVRKGADWGKKLSQGRVAYAVESLEPTKAVLYTKVEDEVKAMRDSFFRTNSLGNKDIFCKIEYGNPSTSRVTLEEVEVVLPYSVDIMLRDQGE